jgi:HAD superfamily hydrolase (TIGR01450 family)
MDRKLTYQKLSRALQALLQGADFVASNDDSTFPTPYGIIPGAGAIVGAIKGMGYQPKEVVGKPSSISMNIAMQAAGVRNSKECLLIGDRLETDIFAAQQVGMDSVLVLTGVTSRKNLKQSDIQPTWTVENLTRLLN